ncbi:Uncharacterised protein [Moraxella caprae]|uniref:Uncharacterized protein n=1 Tax=Moraxella caprae TaxID=90240 RepID=A0A378R0D7_9GAMM|nr:hypothetical protein [Moraxella caprae]STZ08488.1 Uncharacterised protein [Moraxella caprae]
MKVQLSDWLEANLSSFDKSIQQAIFAFMFHVNTHGIQGLKGRNKSSIPQNPHTRKEREYAKIAQKYCLWHYHLGVPYYIEQANGDLTSEYILHYCYYDDVIILVDIGTHPPFYLPSLDKLNV